MSEYYGLHFVLVPFCMCYIAYFGNHSVCIRLRATWSAIQCSSQASASEQIIRPKSPGPVSYIAHSLTIPGLPQPCSSTPPKLFAYFNNFLGSLIQETSPEISLAKINIAKKVITLARKTILLIRLMRINKDRSIRSNSIGGR